MIEILNTKETKQQNVKQKIASFLLEHYGLTYTYSGAEYLILALLHIYENHDNRSELSVYNDIYGGVCNKLKERGINKNIPCIERNIRTLKQYMWSNDDFKKNIINITHCNPLKCLTNGTLILNTYEYMYIHNIL